MSCGNSTIDPEVIQNSELVFKRHQVTAALRHEMLCLLHSEIILNYVTCY